MEQSILKMKDIVKTFGCFTANDHVNLEVRKGEIHALLGENGAGKSTLMNILYGLYRQDSGQILLNGSPVNFHGPSDAIAHNIGMVHQHFMLVQPFTVAENLILGCEPTKGLRLDLKKAHEMIRNVSDRYGLHVDPDAKISDISVGMQQRVEILKILLRDAKILIFDEPTAALTPQEIQDLFVILRKLRENGHTILIITHKLKEIKQISDRVTVIRKGQNVGTVETADTSEQQLAELMVGRKVILQTSRDKHEPGRVVLQMQNVHARNARGIEALRGLSLQVRAGEIVGIAGVEGNGQSEIALVLKRMLDYSAGQIIYNGKPYTKKLTTQQLIDSGLSHIPEDRQKHGLVLGFSIRENMVLCTEDWPKFRRGPFQNRRAIVQYSETSVHDYDIRCTNIEQTAQSLSGGNQQKVILAREISRNPQFILICQPTRGLDVGAIEYVHTQILQLRKLGCAILLISYELDEIMQLSDRILTIYNGQITANYRNGEVTSEQIGLAMTGFSRTKNAEGGASNQ